MKKILFLVPFILVVFLIEWVGHWFTMTSLGDWYVNLHKPSWNPPSWVFGPIWTILYISIAVSGWLIFIKVKSSPKKQAAFIVYGLQLLCNFLWTYFFFFLRSPGYAFIDLLLLVILIAINIFAFWKLYRPAGILLIPYFIWTIFAAILNLAICIS